jgi:acyl carrier protein
MIFHGLTIHAAARKTKMALDEKVREALARVAKAPIPTDREVSLFDNGVIDSFDLVDFVADLEKEFNIKVPDNDLHPSKFESLAKIAAYLSSQGAA